MTTNEKAGRMTVIRWICVFLLLCLAFAALGAGKVLTWLGDAAEDVAERLTIFAALVSP